MQSFFTIATQFLVYYFFVINTFYAVLVFFAVPAIYKRFKEVGLEDIYSLVGSESLPSIAIILPMFNEGKGGVSAIRNMLHLEYPTKEIIVVNDGSSDDTLKLVIEEFSLEPSFAIPNGDLATGRVRGVYRTHLYPNLLVVDKDNMKSKSDANNVGINYSFSTLYLNVDGDTVLEPDALLRMVRPYMTDKNLLTQGGTIRILNGCTVEDGKITNIDVPKGFFEGIQVVEYLRSFVFGRLGWNKLGGNLIVSGAFGLFDRSAVLEVGGYNTKAIGEDFELTIQLTEYQKRLGRDVEAVMFIPDPVAWTDVPRTYQELGKQRARWHQGLCDTMWFHKHLFFNPKYGLTGLIGYPYMFFGELLEPIVETLGYILLVVGLTFGYMSGRDAIILLFVTWGITSMLTMIATVLEVSTFRRYRKFSQFIRLFTLTMLEAIGYRQMYIWWRYQGFWRYFKSTQGYY